MAEDKFVFYLANDLHNQIEAMTDEDLQRLVAECEGKTSTNCWWFEYRLSEVILEYVKNEIAYRSEKAGKG